jgi:alanine racemase
MRPVVACIDADALGHNLSKVKELCKESKVLAMVKANAYGHSVDIVTSVLKDKVDAFGVCSLEEALEIRKNKISTPIVMVEGCFESEEMEIAIKNNITISITNPLQFGWLKSFLFDNRTSDIWIKLNSGMNRIGLTEEDFIRVVEYCKNSKYIKNIVLMTHLHSADTDVDSSVEQINTLKRISSKSKFNLELSWCNSASILQDKTRGGSWVRPGIMLYGASPLENNLHSLKPVMVFTSKLIDIFSIKKGEKVGYSHTWKAEKNTTVGIVACGYGDGYPREVGADTYLIINGNKCKIIGRISMDLLAVELGLSTSSQKYLVGDLVELWGKNIPVSKVANFANTISYTLLTSVSKRVVRKLCNFFI